MLPKFLVKTFSNLPLASMSWNIGLPPSVADTKKWVPYFLIRFSWICWRLGLLPRSLRLRKNSGAKGSGALKKSLFSVTKLFTFQWLNSLRDKTNTVSALMHVADFRTHYVSSVIGRTENRTSIEYVCARCESKTKCWYQQKIRLSVHKYCMVLNIDASHCNVGWTRFGSINTIQLTWCNFWQLL